MPDGITIIIGNNYNYSTRYIGSNEMILGGKPVKKHWCYHVFFLHNSSRYNYLLPILILVPLFPTLPLDVRIIFFFFFWMFESSKAVYVTMSLCHYVTMSLCHYVTMPLCHYVTMSLCHYVTMSLCHYVTMSLCHYVTMSLCHYVTMPLCHYATMSLCHYVTMSLINMSLCYWKYILNLMLTVSTSVVMFHRATWWMTSLELTQCYEIGFYAIWSYLIKGGTYIHTRHEIVNCVNYLINIINLI